MTLDNTHKYNDEPDDTVKVDDETERWIREAGLGESGSEARKRRRKMEKLRAEWEKKDADPSVQYNMLEVRPANDWMNFLYEDRPSRRLFGDLWRENDLSILFADTGVGKSVLAVQIADSIARSEQIEPLTMNVDAQKVLYLDFEMSEQQFTERYSATSGDGQTFANKYVFPDDFLVAHIDSDTALPKRFKTVVEYMYASIVGRIEESGARILIVDNISYLSPTAGGSSSALKLMKALKYLKSQYKLSILVLAHTTKRHFASPLTVNDLAGSKTLANFADNVFTIGHSHYDRNLRYVPEGKQTAKVVDGKFVFDVTPGEAGAGYVVRVLAGKAKTELVLDGEYPYEYYGYGDGGHVDSTPRPDARPSLRVSSRNESEIRRHRRPVSPGHS